ncbi:MAG: T9SS type A sorting domain-containing protein [candidate division Zixibacteria bacterium]|nr:T9SS type A sorting domain-containing protein [candidate division Zixibacteria bacterium]
MVKWLTGLFTFLIVSTSVYAGNYQVDWTDVVMGAENYTHIEPLMDNEGRLVGFVYADTAAGAVVVDRFASDDTLMIFALDGIPRSTAGYLSDDGDTLFLYAAYARPGETPGIARIVAFPDGAMIETVHPECYSTYGDIVDAGKLEVGLRRANDGTIEGVRFEATLRYEEYIFTMGRSAEDISTSILFAPDLREEIVREAATSIRIGNLRGDEDTERISFDDYYYRYDFDELSDAVDSGEVRHSTVLAYDDIDNLIAYNSSYEGRSHDIVIGQFKPDDALEELIYHGNSNDLLGFWPGPTEHLACYSFAGDSVTELWYTEIGPAKLEMIYRPDRAIVTRSETGRVIFYDYSNGKLIDSIEINPDLEAVSFFAENSDEPQLFMAGRIHDTLLVYQLDMTIYDWEPAVEQVVPATFTLYQNHPNPFNGETEIRYDTEESQHISLNIYNILGQEIAILVDRVVSPGTYFVSWSGSDDEGLPQSSGIYFARLQAGGQSQMTKLIYLK